MKFIISDSVVLVEMKQLVFLDFGELKFLLVISDVEKVK